MLGENQRLLRRRNAILFLFLLPALLAACGRGDLQFPTEHQAVFLDNGQVFFGRIKDDGSCYLTLWDVYYIKEQASPDKKEAQSILVKRGSEWHAPGFMRINTRHIIYIEPVAPDSRVALLIREVQAHPVVAPPAANPAAALAPPGTPAPGPAARGTPATKKPPATQR